MVVTSQSDATRAGVAMLESGGNAIDAAVASAFALAVTEPNSTGIGGGAFVLIRLASGEVVAVDARETAPAAADRDLYVRPGVPKDASLLGGLAVGTPGLVAGLALVQERWGTKPLAEVMAPAIRLAEEGYAVGLLRARLLEQVRQMEAAKRFPDTAAIQLPPNGAPVDPEWRLVQKDLARTLRRIADEGPRAFYEGELAEAIAAEVKRQGGILTPDDLRTYAPVVREPSRGSYRGYEVASFPPPSSGGVILLEILNILEGFDLGSRGFGSSASAHLLAEAMKLAFADRAEWLGDPDFVSVPAAGLVSKEYAASLRARINPPWFRRAPWRWGADDVAIRVERAGEPPRDAGTTHLSATDAAGNAVALTETINTLYGSWVTVPRTGILLNNEMDDFAKAVGVANAYGLVDTRGQNAVAPRKRPLSSMTPAILSKDGRLFMVSGSPGGPRIISTVLLSIVNVVDFGQDAVEAVSAPRIHHQWIPDQLAVEAAVPADVVEGLRARGHTVVVERDWSAAAAIVVDPKTGLHLGGSDPRRDGLALGH
jgi:gamma-glutamyltranspeptidase/glutathione hydrolase